MDKSDNEEKDKKKEKKHKKKKKHKKEKEEKKLSESDKSEDEKEKEEYEKQKDDIIVDNFILLLEMGRGAFGQIHLTFSKRDGIAVATKKEIKQSMTTYPQLKMEFNVLRNLLKVPAGSNISVSTDLSEFNGQNPISQSEIPGFPKVYGFGEQLNYYYLIIQLLGPNLVDLFNYCKCKFSVPTVCMVVIQMISRIEYIHSNNYLHRDIKPENFLIGCGQLSNVLYLIDYGLCRRYRDKANQHIAYRENKSMTGTVRYVSINTHLGIEQSRRDDLESIAYVIIYFMKGSLPWQGIKGGLEKFSKIGDKKLQIPTEVLCKGLPDEFSIFLNYCKGLRFEDKPDYDFLKGLFSKLLNQYIEGYMLTKGQLKYDWTFEDKNYFSNILEKKNPKISRMLSKRDNKVSSKFSSKVIPREDIPKLTPTPQEQIQETLTGIEKKPEEERNIFDDLANNILKNSQRNQEKIDKVPERSESSNDSELTEKKDIKHSKGELNISHDGKSAELEDIDHFIHKIKRGQEKKSSKTPGKSADVSDATIELKPNNDKIEINKNTVLKNDTDSENSFINFVNLKKNKTSMEAEVKNEELNMEHLKKKFGAFKTFKEEPNFEN